MEIKYIFPDEHDRQLNISTLKRRSEIWHNLIILSKDKQISLQEANAIRLVAVNWLAFGIFLLFLAVFFAFGIGLRVLRFELNFTLSFWLSTTFIVYLIAFIGAYISIPDAYWVRKHPEALDSFNDLTRSNIRLEGKVSDIWKISDQHFVISFEFITPDGEKLANEYISTYPVTIQSGDKVLVWYSKTIQVLL